MIITSHPYIGHSAHFRAFTGHDGREHPEIAGVVVAVDPGTSEHPSMVTLRLTDGSHDRRALDLLVLDGGLVVRSIDPRPFATGTTWITLPPAPLTLDKLRAMLEEPPHPQSIARLVPLESLRGVIEQIDRLTAELAEARATLDNDRGDGEPPSEGWVFLDDDAAGDLLAWRHPGPREGEVVDAYREITSLDWTWTHFGQDGEILGGGTSFAHARVAMRAADAAKETDR